MKKRLAIILAALGLVAAIAACGPKKTETTAASASSAAAAQTTPAETTKAAETTPAAKADTAAQGVLPEYTYPGEESANSAIARYIIKEIGSLYEKTDLCIPFIDTIAVDDSNQDDIKVWGNFWVGNYAKEGDSLVYKSGGHCPGLMHVKFDKASGKYEVTKFEEVSSGSDNGESAKQIFGDYLTKLQEQSKDEVQKALENKTLTEYFTRNNLTIKEVK